MRFEAAATFLEGDTGVDPLADPELVTDDKLLLLARRQSDAGVLGKRILLALDEVTSVGAETITLNLWALDEATDPVNDEAPDLSRRRFYRFATGVVVSSSVITEVTAAAPAGGKVYAQQTADTFGAGLTRTVRATCMA